MTNGQGTLRLNSNWLAENYRNSFESTSAIILESVDNITGTDPAFKVFNQDDFRLSTGSDCNKNAGSIANGAASYSVGKQYVEHQSSETRSDAGDTIGAPEVR